MIMAKTEHGLASLVPEICLVWFACFDSVEV